MITAAYAQRAYRARNDTVTLDSTTWTYALNTAWTQDRDTRFRLRVQGAETAGGAENNVTWTLQYAVNGGAWTSADALLTASTQFTNGAAIASPGQLGGSGTWIAGVGRSVSPTDYVVTFVGTDYFEIEYSLLLPNTLANGDTVTFRLLGNGLTVTETVTPTLTVSTVVVSTANLDAGSIALTGYAATGTTRGMVLHLDANAITGLTNGDPVATWADESGNGYDATQTTAADRPTYVTNVLGGKPVVRFDGADWMTLGSIAAGSPLAMPGGVVTVFAVVRQDSGSAGWQRIIDKSDGGNGANGWAVPIMDPVGRAVYAAAGGTGPKTSDNVYDLGTWHLITGGINGTAWFARVDGVAAAGSGTGTVAGIVDATTNAAIGAWNHTADRRWDGDIAEIRVYNYALSTSERDAVEAELTSKWLAVGSELGAGTFAVAGFATAATTVTPLTAGTFTVTGFATTPIVAAPLDAGTFTLSGFATAANTSAPLAQGTFTLTGLDPGASTTAPVPAGSYAVTGYEATGATASQTNLDAGAFALAGFASAATASIPLDAGSYALTGYPISSVAATQGDLDPGSYAVTGHATTATTTVPLDAGTFTLTGFGTTATTVTPATAGTYDLTGYALAGETTTTLDAGAYALAGFATTGSTSAPLDAGAYSLTGFNTSGAGESASALNTGTLTLAGYDLTASTTATLPAGTYSVSGYSTTATTSTTSTLDAGTIAVTGFGTLASTTHPLDTGAYALAGFDTGATGTSTSDLTAGALTITGYALTGATSITLDAGGYALGGFALEIATHRPLDLGTIILTGYEAVSRDATHQLADATRTVITTVDARATTTSADPRHATTRADDRNISTPASPRTALTAAEDRTIGG